MRNKKISDNKYTIVFFIFVVLGAILFVYRAPFSTGGWDEPFFLSVAHRLTKGDALLMDEWHVSQLFGFLLYPIMKVYLSLAGTTEGIVLAFRYIYAAFHIIGAVCVYKCLAKWKLGGLVASLYYLFYLPNNVMNFSYNTIGLFCTLLSLLLMVVPEKEKAWKYIVSGVLFALGVLACPYNMLMYVVYALMVFTVTLRKKSNRDIALRGADMKTLAYVTIGAFLVAVLFAIFVLSRATIKEILDNLPYILSDSQHNMSIFMKLLWYPASFWLTFGYMCIVWLVLALMVLLDKKRQERGVFYFIITAVTVLIELALKINLNPDGHNAMMFPIVIWGFVAYMLLKNKNRAVFAYGYLGGLLYSLCKLLASSGNMEAIAAGAVVSGVVSILFIVQYVQENEYIGFLRKVVTGVMIVVFSLHITGEAYALCTNFFGTDLTTFNMKVRLSEGPLKGIKTSEENAYTENASLKDIYFIKDKEPGKILFATKRTWYYFWTDMEYATPSCWINDLDSNYVEILNDYYRLHPDKLPDYIYIAAGEGWDYTDIEEQAGEKSYKVIRTGRGCFLERVK